MAQFNEKLARFDVPEDISIEDFFSNYVPGQFKESVADVDLAGCCYEEI